MYLPLTLGLLVKLMLQFQIKRYRNRVQAKSTIDESCRLTKSKANCCVPFCSKIGYVLEDGKRVTFHTLPKDKDRLKIWLVNMKRDTETFKVSKSTRICSRHFQDRDFRTTHKGLRYLKEFAIPSIFNWEKEGIEKTRKKFVRSTPQSAAKSTKVISQR